MKPPRIAMTHDLILGYGLHEHLDVYVSRLIDTMLYNINIQIDCTHDIKVAELCARIK